MLRYHNVFVITKVIKTIGDKHIMCAESTQFRIAREQNYVGQKKTIVRLYMLVIYILFCVFLTHFKLEGTCYFAFSRLFVTITNKF